MPFFKPNVSFKSNPVDGISKPLSPMEYDALSWFEKHARSCRKCFKPYSVYKQNGVLCTEGLNKALKVEDMQIKQRSDGRIYRYIKPTHGYYRIEVPEEWTNVRGLLKAMQRSGNTFLDSSYPITSRTSSRSSHTERPSSSYGDYKYRSFVPEEPTERHSSSKKKHPTHPARQGRISLTDDWVRYDEGHVYLDSRSGYPSTRFYSNGKF
jgi:hypothetical protein